MTEVEDGPKWLLELENRKRKRRLGHETGAGAPCLTCASACSGLDLHFWRKICKNCKCRGDDHDFDDDEFPQFEILFGPNVKKKTKNCSVLLKVNDKKQSQSVTSFEWVPPDASKELAADYMKALPSDKRPITGSAGATLRRQQLLKQLPLHDIDHKACNDLCKEEKKEFDKYLNQLKKCAGQGKVSKLMAIQQFYPAHSTPANATDVQCFSPQHTRQLSENQKGGSSLCTPSSFRGVLPSQGLRQSGELDKVLGSKSGYNWAKLIPGFSNDAVGNNPVASNIDVIRAQQLQAISETNPLGRYHHVFANVSGDCNLARAANVPGTYYTGGHPLTASHHENDRLSNINPTACELSIFKNDHLLANEEYAQGSVAQRAEECTQNNLRVARLEKIFGQAIDPNLKCSSVLPASNASIAEQILSEALLPPSAVNANDIVGSSLDEQGLAHIRGKLSDKYGNSKHDQPTAPIVSRDFESISQHPVISSSEVIKRSAETSSEFERQPTNPVDFCARNQQILALGHRQSPYTAHTERLPVQLDTSLTVQSNVIHSEALSNPVFPEESVGGVSTANQNQEDIDQLQDELQGLKMNTYNRRECARCEDDIYPGQVVVTADTIKDAVWHPGCFKCCACNELLVDLVYFTYKSKLYCGRDLAKLLEIPRCHACDELIFVKEYTVAEGNNYHVKHFCCWDCDTPLANQLYVVENDRPLCLPCYQKYYAKTCNACNSAIAADQNGVAIKDLNFHANAECFCCVTCKKSLLNGQIAIKENKLLCSKECIAEFLHRRKMGR